MKPPLCTDQKHEKHFIMQLTTYSNMCPESSTNSVVTGTKWHLNVGPAEENVPVTIKGGTIYNSL